MMTLNAGSNDEPYGLDFELGKYKGKKKITKENDFLIFFMFGFTMENIKEDQI